MICSALAMISLAKSMTLYIGTYTSPEGSKGIYRATLNPADGKLSDPVLVAECNAPSFLALTHDGKTLAAVDEGSGGVIHQFEVGEKLHLTGTQNWPGGGPCHISFSPDGKYIFGAAYGAGSFAQFTLKEPAGWFQNAGSGPHSGRQEGPHAHSLQTDPKGKYAYGCDLGTDEILVFPVAEKEFKPVHRVKVKPGSGPRHLLFAADGKTAYVNMELTNEVASYLVEPDGSLKLVDTLSTLPTGQTHNTTAEIVLHPNGKWLYVSNRGHDSLAIYEVRSGGHLKLVDIELAGVREPRSFAIDPTGHWLVTAGQNSNDLATLSIDPKTGRLKPTGSRVKVSAPVCVVFAP